MNDYKRIERAILFIEQNALEQPSLQDIANHVGLSEFHFQRLFKRWAGISPKRFVQYLTAQQCRVLLRGPESSLDVALDCGLSGPSRLHDLIVNIYAMTPEEYRRGGQSIVIEYGWHQTPFGWCLLAITDKGVCWMSFHDDRSGLEQLRKEWSAAAFHENPDATHEVAQRIFAGVREQPQSVMVHVKGTNLQVRVWEALLNIPRHDFATYSQIATNANHPRAVRAVASAVGRNMVAYVIPCHRVLRKSGALGGYRWGLPRKAVMNAWESAQLMHTESRSTDEPSRVPQLSS